MLPISDVIFAKRLHNANFCDIDYILYDVYKISTDFPLEISAYGHIILNDEAANAIKIMDKFLRKSTRDDLKGLKLTCARVVCYICKFFFLHFFLNKLGFKGETQKKKATAT